MFQMNRKQRRLMARRSRPLSGVAKMKRNEDKQYADHWGLPPGVRVDPSWLNAHHEKGRVARKKKASKSE
jgi:hypothetical protein